MGQTNEYSFADEDGAIWTWVYICPECENVLATQRLVDESMGLGPDDVIGCDDCGIDVTVEMAQLVIEGPDGERAY